MSDPVERPIPDRPPPGYWQRRCDEMRQELIDARAELARLREERERMIHRLRFVLEMIDGLQTKVST